MDTATHHLPSPSCARARVSLVSSGPCGVGFVISNAADFGYDTSRDIATMNGTIGRTRLRTSAAAGVRATAPPMWTNGVRRARKRPWSPPEGGGRQVGAKAPTCHGGGGGDAFGRSLRAVPASPPLSSTHTAHCTPHLTQPRGGTHTVPRGSTDWSGSGIVASAMKDRPLPVNETRA